MVHVETSRVKETGLVLRNTDFQRIAEAQAARSQQHFLVLKLANPFSPSCFGAGLQAEVVELAQRDPTLCWMR